MAKKSSTKKVAKKAAKTSKSGAVKKKAATKKVAKKPVAKKAAAKKIAKKAVAKKAVAKKSTTKKVAKKAVTKKVAAKKTVAKKATAKAPVEVKKPTPKKVAAEAAADISTATIAEVSQASIANETTDSLTELQGADADSDGNVAETTAINEPAVEAVVERAGIDNADEGASEPSAPPPQRLEEKAVLTGDELLQHVGFGKKMIHRKPLVEMSRGKDPIQLHHRPPTRKELSDLREKLLERFAELNSDVAQLESEVHNAEESNAGRTDIIESSSAQYDQEFMLQRIESESEELHFVRRALAKMDGKIPGQEYGRCEATGIWISIERLNARPHARLCVAAVEKFEREGGGEEYGVPFVGK